MDRDNTGDVPYCLLRLWYGILTHKYKTVVWLVYNTGTSYRVARSFSFLA